MEQTFRSQRGISMSETHVALSDIGARIRQERERLKLSVAEFANGAGVSDRSQRNYESGERLPDAEYLFKAGALDADTDFILFGENSPARRLAKSVQDECLVLGKVLADIDREIERAKVFLDPIQKAKCIVYLYRMERFHPVNDQKIYEELVMLAAGRQLL